MANKWKDKSSKIWENAWNKNNLGNSLGSIGSGITGIVESAVANSKIADTIEEESFIDSVGNTKFGSGSFTNLLSDFNVNELARTNFTAKDLRGLTTGQMLGQTLSGIGSGAIAGAQVGGPWGAVAGAATGLLGGLAGIFTGNSKARRKAAELNKLAEQANENYLNNFNNAVINTQNTMFNNSLLNIAAKGGKIYIKPQNRDSLGGNLFDDGGLMFQHGGIFPNGITIIGNGGTHEENPFEGVQIGVDNQGVPNMVEEGEVIWQDYVFSNRLQPSEAFKKKYKVKGKTFADVAKELQKESEERPNDPISKRGLEDGMAKLMMEQEFIRQSEDSENNTFSKRGMKKNKYDKGSWLRYAPVAGSTLGVFSDLIGTTNKPDYSNINLIQDATDRFTPIDYTPIGTYLSYTPFDKNFYSARLGEQAAATRRAITNQAINPGIAMAGLLSADYNAQTQLGELFRQAEEYNQAQREKVAGFNRQTDAINSEMAMKAAMANQSADELKLKSAITQAQLREQADATASAARSANITNLFENLGTVGKEGFMMDMINNNPALLYDYMGRYKGTPKSEKACGGKINRRRSK